jgi:Fe-S-cluster containining protein
MADNKNPCSRCGQCCREVFFAIDKAYTEDGLDHLEWAQYHGFTITYRDDIYGRRLWGVELNTPCMHLRDETDGKTSCAIYENRPKMCRDYSGEKNFPDCNYS